MYPRGAPICRSVYIATAAVPLKGVVYYENGADDDTTDIHALFVKRARGSKEGIVTSKQPTVPAQDDLARTPVRVLRRVYFLNEERTRYVSVGFYHPTTTRSSLSSGVRGSTLYASRSNMSGI